MSEIRPTFAGEMQLAGWSETHNGGCKVTFWLPDATDLDAFRALTVRKGNTAGHRFMAALVEVGDDEQPVQQPAAKEHAPVGGALAKLAGMWCSDPDFWAFLSARTPSTAPVADAEAAAQVIRDVCQIESRAELDHIPESAEMFHAEIRLPFMRWKQGVRG
ncbi:hypothetical protein E5S69_20640 [Cupriavidus necator]|uniref:hypothetical protein n=1 Tax=Cupriavidus necator TaxID=106590 RepID=UPI001490550C|nr:hypothetical protein [Cupriavidus necator]NOV25913.1 hypothetical protein [Cupriavidus necator]